MSTLYHREKTVDYVIGYDGVNYYAQDEYGVIRYEKPGGGALINAVIVALSPTGGEVLLKCLVIVDDEDVELLVLPKGSLGFTGIGARGGSTSATWLNSRSGFAFSGGFVITNNLVSLNGGNHIFRNMGMFWSGVVNKPCFLMDNVFPKLDHVYACESGNTFPANGVQGVFTHDSTTVPTPSTSSVVFDHVTIIMRSDNCVGYYCHFENPSWIHPVMQFNATGCRGWVVASVSGQTIDQLDVWLGDPAQGCVMFQLENQGKWINIEHIECSSQANAGNVTPNILFGYKVIDFSDYTNDDINIWVGTLVKIPMTTTPTAPIYAYQDANMIGRTRIGMVLDTPTYGVESHWYCSTCDNTDLLSDGTDEYLFFTGDDAPDTVEANQQIQIHDAMIIEEMIVFLEEDPGAGNSRTFTLRVDGISQAQTVTIANTDKVGHDAAHPITVDKDAFLDWLSDGGVGGPDVSEVNIRCRATPIRDVYPETMVYLLVKSTLTTPIVLADDAMTDAGQNPQPVDLRHHTKARFELIAESDGNFTNTIYAYNETDAEVVAEYSWVGNDLEMVVTADIDITGITNRDGVKAIAMYCKTSNAGGDTVRYTNAKVRFYR